MKTNVERQAVRLLLVDDHRCMIVGLARLLDDDPLLQVVGMAGCLREAEEELVRHAPDVVLLDLQLGGGESGFAFVPRAKELQPRVKIIVFSTYDGEFYRQHAEGLGVHGYVAKGADVEVLKAAIHKAMQAGEAGDAESDAGGAQKTLSHGEAHVIRCLANGLSQKETACEIGISPSTVATHVQRAKEKLGARSVMQLISLAGLVPVEAD